MKTEHCAECEFLFQERAAIHQFDGKLSRQEAERRAAGERCAVHRGDVQLELTTEKDETT